MSSKHEESFFMNSQQLNSLIELLLLWLSHQMPIFNLNANEHNYSTDSLYYLCISHTWVLVSVDRGVHFKASFMSCRVVSCCVDMSKSSSLTLLDTTWHYCVHWASCCNCVWQCVHSRGPVQCVHSRGPVQVHFSYTAACRIKLNQLTYHSPKMSSTVWYSWYFSWFKCSLIGHSQE